MMASNRFADLARAAKTDNLMVTARAHERASYALRDLGHPGDCYCNPCCCLRVAMDALAEVESEVAGSEKSDARVAFSGSPPALPADSYVNQYPSRGVPGPWLPGGDVA